MIVKTVTVKLVTPAMIGGSEAGKCDDPPTLRPPAMRGMLRFWTRALGGVYPAELESRLWGSTETGQGVVVLNSLQLPQPQPRFLLPHKDPPASGERKDKRTRTPMCCPDGRALTIRFRIPDEDSIEPLRAVVWTWLHLGAIGRRSRRGYGSMHWLPSKENDDLFQDSLHFNETEHLASREALEEYLKRGLQNLKAGCGLCPPSPNTDRQSSSWFRLTTLDQVFVGRELVTPARAPIRCDQTKTGIEALIHGRAWKSRDSLDKVARQLGGGGAPGERLASPMMWRLLRTPGGSYIPVMTWSPREAVTKIPPGSGMYAYLNGILGFDRSLAGNPLG